MALDVKESGKRNDHFVAVAHKTEPPKNSEFCAVASLRNLQTITTLAELNRLELCQGDLSSVCLGVHH